MSAHDPDHYKFGGIESIDVIRARLTPEEFAGFCKGNAMKYLHRMGHKGDAAEDALKAAKYLGWLAEAGEPGAVSPVGPTGLSIHDRGPGSDYRWELRCGSDYVNAFQTLAHAEKYKERKERHEQHDPYASPPGQRS